MSSLVMVYHHYMVMLDAGMEVIGAGR
jgi:hypothetical protein